MTFTLQDYLVQLHPGQWFGFDSKEPNYENLVMLGEYSKPTEQECNDGIAAMQAEHDWLSARLADMKDGGYGSITEQLEMIGEQGMDVYQTHVQTVKTNNPKA
jgi:hypothetical protein